MPQRRALLLSIVFTLLIAAATIAARDVLTSDAANAPEPTTAATTATVTSGQTVTVPLADLLTQQASAGEDGAYAGDDEGEHDSHDDEDHEGVNHEQEDDN
jgi:hypothetical protein